MDAAAQASEIFERQLLLLLAQMNVEFFHQHDFKLRDFGLSRLITVQLRMTKRA
jgi:hypothetical protein